VQGKAYQELTQHYPEPGWVEHDPEEIFESVVGVGRKAIWEAGLQPNDISAIGITNQRETSILWERATSKPVYPAIVWQCRRTSSLCASLKKRGVEPMIRHKTGLLLDPYFSGTKVAWMIKNVAGAGARAKRNELAFGTVDSWLIWKFTDGRSHCTDFTNASRTLLFDIHQRTWSPKLCKLFGVPPRVLPEVKSPMSHFGTTTKSYFGAEIPISGVAGDQQAALFGHGGVIPGATKCTFGTGAFILAYGGSRVVTSKHKLLTTLVCDKRGRPAYGLEGSIFMAGAIMQWLRDGLNMIENASESEKLAHSVPDSGGVMLIPAFVGLGAPYWRPEARGALLGLTRGTERAHIVRAALESIAFQVEDLLNAMASDLGRSSRELRVDGGATANQFLMQFLSDITKLPIVRPQMAEMTAFGAARLAASTLKLWSDSYSTVAGDTRFEPKIHSKERNRLKNAWKRALDRVL
jgi:glycerol kinase